MKDECDNCNYKTEVKEYDTGVPETKYKFCNICASTFLSRATSYPRQYGEQAALFQSIGYIANLLLDEIRKAQETK